MSLPQGAPEQAADDPSMEDILASIRRILKDDEVPALRDPASAAAGEEVFVLDQTMLIEAPPSEPSAMSPGAILPKRAEPGPESPASSPMRHEQEPAVAAALAADAPPLVLAEPDLEAPLLAPAAAAAATASLGALVRVVGQQQTSVHRGGGVTLEDMVRDEIRPLVKTWLDENLAPMVERMVRAEIARVTGGK